MSGKAAAIAAVLLKVSPAIIFTAAIVVFFWNLRMVRNFTMDDAFIYLRYAENLVYHGVLDYNLDGEMNEGFTTFLYTLLLATFRWLGGNPVYQMKAIGVVSLAATCGLTVGAIRTLMAGSSGRNMAALWACIVLLVFPPTAFHAVSGMETMFFSMCLSLLMFTWARARVEPTVGTISCFGLAALVAGLCRPDGNLPAVLLGVDLALRVKRKREFAVILFASYVAPGIIYFWWRYSTYGVFLPLPFYVKVTASGHFQGIREVARYHEEIAFISLFLPFFALTRWRTVWPIALIVGLFSIFYLKPLHNMGYESRFMFPMTSLIIIMGAYSVCSRRRFAIGLMAASALAGAWVSLKRHEGAFQEWVRYVDTTATIENGLVKHLIEFRARHGDAWLATNDAGIIPYYSGLPTLDILGLNNKNIAVRGYTADYVFSKDPEILAIVSLDPRRYKSMTPNEERMLKDALVRGYKMLAVYKANPEYYYLILGKSARVQRFFKEIVEGQPDLRPDPLFKVE